MLLVRSRWEVSKPSFHCSPTRHVMGEFHGTLSQPDFNRTTPPPQVGVVNKAGSLLKVMILSGRAATSTPGGKRQPTKREWAPKLFSRVRRSTTQVRCGGYPIQPLPRLHLIAKPPRVDRLEELKELNLAENPFLSREGLEPSIRSELLNELIAYSAHPFRPPEVKPCYPNRKILV